MFDVVPSLSNKVVEVVPSMPSMVPAGSYTSPSDWKVALSGAGNLKEFLIYFSPFSIISGTLDLFFINSMCTNPLISSTKLIA